MSSSFFTLGLVLMIITACQTQDIRVSSQVGYSTSYGPTIELSCFVSDYPVCSGTPDVQWLLKDVIISENDQLIEGDPTKYRQNYGQNTHDNVTSVTSKLFILDAQKSDEGNYTCRIETLKASTDLQVHFFLPHLDFPKCSIEPQLTVLAGTNISLTCGPGNSNPPVNLNLKLRRPDGSDLLLGTADTTRQVIRQATAEDDGAMFVCHMTSNTFRTAFRECSAGPLTITETTSTPPTSRITEAITELKSIPSPPTLSTNDIATKSSLQHDTENPSSCSSTPYINALIAPITIAIISIVGNIFLLWKNRQLKKSTVSRKDMTMVNEGVDGPYMELLKTSKPESDEYMDMNRGTVGSNDEGRKYENIAESAHGNDSATNYEVVGGSLKEADVDDTTDYDDVA